MVRPLMHLAKKCLKRWAGLHPYVILSRHSSYLRQEKMGNLMEHFFLSGRKILIKLFPSIHSHLFSLKIKREQRMFEGFGQNCGLKRDTAGSANSKHTVFLPD